MCILIKVFRRVSTPKVADDGATTSNVTDDAATTSKVEGDQLSTVDLLFSL